MTAHKPVPGTPELMVFPDMTCCKPMRRQAGLECEAGWMVCCLASACANLPTLEQRRRFAETVSRVKRLADPAMQEAFRTQVGERFLARRRSA